MLGVKSDKKGFNQAENGLNKLTSLATKAIAAFSAFKIAQFFKNMIFEVAELGDQFDKMSKRSGVASTELQKLGFAAQLSGASIGDMETGIKRLQAAQIEAIDGVATYADEFKRMGVEVKNTDGSIKDTSQLIVEMADGIKNLETDAERTAVAMKLLGRGGAQLVPLLKQGAEAVAEMMAEMKALGGVIDDDLKKASADFIDNQLRMDVVFQGIKNTIAKELLPFLNKSVEGFTAWWKINGDFIRQKVGDTIKRIGRVLGGVGTVIKEVAKFFTKWIKDIGPTEKSIAKIGVAVGILGSLIASGPVGQLLALISVIGLVVDDFQTWQKGGKSVTGAIVKWFNDILDIDIVSWVKTGISWFEKIGGIVLKLAQSLVEFQFAIVKLLVTMWEDPEKAFNAFINELDIMWSEFWKVFTEAFPNASIAIEEFVAKSIKNLGEFFVWIGEVAGRTFDAIGIRIQNKIQTIMDAIEKVRQFMANVFGTAKIEKIDVEAALKNAKNLKVLTGGGETTPRTTQASPGAGGTTVINKPNTNISVDVKAAPGMSATALADAAAKKISQAMDKQNRKTIKAFTPAAGG
jgi:hypothetical protein